MLKGLFDLDNPLMQFLSKVAQVLELNLLFLVCSIPVFTIGASLTALYYCFFKEKDGQEGYLIRKFFKSFKENFKQATLLWLILLAFFLLLYTEMSVAPAVAGFTGTMMRSMIFLALIFWYLILSYSFALQSRFYNSIKDTLSNAVLMIFINGPFSILITAVAAAMLLITVMQTNPRIFWNLVLFWILFGFALNVMINVELMAGVFKKMMPEPDPDPASDDRHFSVDEEADLSVLGYTPLPPKEDAAQADEETADTHPQ